MQTYTMGTSSLNRATDSLPRQSQLYPIHPCARAGGGGRFVFVGILGI